MFDIELATEDAELIIQTVKLLEPTFGGINLEDIRAPECFEIEERLIAEMDIPVFHDDQHGTAIISGAAFLNALLLTNRRIEETRVVVAGAGAAGIACADLYVHLGVRPENVLMTDSKGVLYAGRTEGMNKYKARYARDTKARTLADALRGADAFVGVSSAGTVTGEMVATMAPKPIIFAMANPDPEITPGDVAAVRGDAIMATGRSDYANQVNNVLGFPFIFRGALDVRATQDQHGDEARGREGAGRARANGRGGPARRGAPRVSGRALRLRSDLHHPQAVRPAGAHPRVDGSGEGGDGQRRGARPHRPRRVPCAAAGAAQRNRGALSRTRKAPGMATETPSHLLENPLAAPAPAKMLTPSHPSAAIYEESIERGLELLERPTRGGGSGARARAARQGSDDGLRAPQGAHRPRAEPALAELGQGLDGASIV